MREIINISLPKEMATQIRKRVKLEGFSTVSEYMRYLFRLENMTKLEKELEKSEREFARGKGKELKSLKDLI